MENSMSAEKMFKGYVEKRLYASNIPLKQQSVIFIKSQNFLVREEFLLKDMPGEVEESPPLLLPDSQVIKK